MVKKGSLVLSDIFPVSYPHHQVLAFIFCRLSSPTIDPHLHVPMVEPEGPPFTLALQSGG